MFFDGSTRSVRVTTSRSPTASVSAWPAARAAGVAATSSSAATSGPKLAAKTLADSARAPRTSRADCWKRFAHRRVWNPAAACAILVLPVALTLASTVRKDVDGIREHSRQSFVQAEVEPPFAFPGYRNVPLLLGIRRLVPPDGSIAFVLRGLGVEHVVARIYDPGRAEVYQRLGIPTVATVKWTADQMLRRLLPQGHVPELVDPSGNVVIAEVTVNPAWVGRRITAIESATGARAAYLTRLGSAILPGADTVFQEGDLVLRNRIRTAFLDEATDGLAPLCHLGSIRCRNSRQVLQHGLNTELGVLLRFAH